MSNYYFTVLNEDDQFIAAECEELVTGDGDVEILGIVKLFTWDIPSMQLGWYNDPDPDWITQSDYEPEIHDNFKEACNQLFYTMNESLFEGWEPTKESPILFKVLEEEFVSLSALKRLLNEI